MTLDSSGPPAPLAALEGGCSGDSAGATGGPGGSSSDDGANRRQRFRGGLGVGLLRTDGDLAGELDGEAPDAYILRFTCGPGGSCDDGANRRLRFRGGLDLCIDVGLLRADGDLAGELDEDTETLTILGFTCVGRDLATAVDGPAVS